MDLPRNIRRVLDAVFGPTGQASQSLRKAVGERAAAHCGPTPGASALPEPLAAYVDKISLTPYKVVDRDIESLKASGLSEDEIYELTVATALGSARGRFERVLGLIDASET